MLENAIYSVISPEGCATILWRDPTRTLDAAKAMKLSSNCLVRYHVTLVCVLPAPAIALYRADFFSSTPEQTRDGVVGARCRSRQPRVQAAPTGIAELGGGCRARRAA